MNLHSSRFFSYINILLPVTIEETVKILHITQTSIKYVNFTHNFFSHFLAFLSIWRHASTYIIHFTKHFWIEIAVIIIRLDRSCSLIYIHESGGNGDNFRIKNFIIFDIVFTFALSIQKLGWTARESLGSIGSITEVCNKVIIVEFFHMMYDKSINCSFR